MTTPTRILHRESGESAVLKMSLLADAPLCRICGLPSRRGAPFRKWLKPTATDWDAWQGPCVDGEGYICEPCAWVRSGRPRSLPGPGELPGPGNLRLLSHVWDEVNGWRWWTKGNKRAIRDAILGCLQLPTGTRWFAAVPDTGQKHSLIFAEVNVTGQIAPVVAFEVEQARIHALFNGAWGCLNKAQAAYQAGWNKAEILCCSPGPRRYKTGGMDSTLQLRNNLQPYSGSVELALAVWLAQREEEEDAGPKSKRSAPKHLERDHGGDRPELSRQAAQDVDTDPGRDGGSSSPDVPPGQVVDPDPPVTPDRKAGQRKQSQLSLFDLVPQG